MAGARIWHGKCKNKDKQRLGSVARAMTCTRLGRRSLLAGAGVVVGSGAATGFPAIWAQNIKNITLIAA
jgi:hypothetical protein